MAGSKPTELLPEAESLVGAIVHVCVPDEVEEGVFHSRQAPLASISGFATEAEVRAGEAQGKSIDPDTLFNAQVPTPIEDAAAAYAINFNLGPNFKLTMDGDRTLSAPTNGEPGTSGFIEIHQDGTGNRLMTFNAAWIFAGGADPVLSTAPGSKDVLTYLIGGSGEIYCSLAKGFG